MLNVDAGVFGWHLLVIGVSNWWQYQKEMVNVVAGECMACARSKVSWTVREKIGWGVACVLVENGNKLKRIFWI